MPLVQTAQGVGRFSGFSEFHSVKGMGFCQERRPETKRHQYNQSQDGMVEMQAWSRMEGKCTISESIAPGG